MKNVKTWNSYSRQNCKRITKTHSIDRLFFWQKSDKSSTKWTFRHVLPCRLPRHPYLQPHPRLSLAGLSLSRQTRVCCDKTCLLSRQKSACRDKNRPHFCRGKIRTTRMCCVMCWTCSDEKDISNQDCHIMKYAHAHSFGENKVRGQKWLKWQADVY